jgi:acetyltransferase
MEHIVQVAQSSTKPLVCIGAGNGLSGRGFEILEEGGVPLFRSFQKGFAGVSHLIRYAEFRRKWGSRHRDLTAPVYKNAAGEARRLVEGRSGGQIEAISKLLLRFYDISTTEEELVTSEGDALAVADRIGYPVALKGMSPQLLHKTDASLVRLGLETPEEVMEAYRDLGNRIASHPTATYEGILVQEMVRPGTEVIVGLSHDPQFGPMLLFGLGGVFVEVLNDVILRAVPISRLDAEAMVSGIRASEVLRGVRGRRPADTEALVDLLLRVSQMAEDLEDCLLELDLNPVVVFEQGSGLKVIDARAVLA